MRLAKPGPATPPDKLTNGASVTSLSAGATTVGAGNPGGAGAGPPYQQHQITRTVGNPFDNLIPPQGVPRFTLKSVSQPYPPSMLSNRPALLDSSIAASPTQASQLPSVFKKLFFAPNRIPSHTLQGLDLSRKHLTTTTWAINRESIEQACAGQTEIASNDGTLVCDLSGM